MHLNGFLKQIYSHTNQEIHGYCSTEEEDSMNPFNLFNDCHGMKRK